MDGTEEALQLEGELRQQLDDQRSALTEVQYPAPLHCTALLCSTISVHAHVKTCPNAAASHV